MPDDEGSVVDMLEAAKQVRELVADIDEESYMQETMRQLAVERLLEIVGEAARRVSEEYKAAHTEVPWRSAIGLRNVITHKYDEVDRSLVWNIAREQVPGLIEALKAIAPMGDA